MDRRYGRRRSRDEEYYSKNGSIPMANYVMNSRNSSKEKKGSADQVKQPIRTLGDWSEFLSSSGKIYFYNQKTEKTQWEKPEEWDWLIQEDKKQVEKNYYSKDYKNNNNSNNVDNRYRNKYDQFEPSNNSKSFRYNENYKNHYRDYPPNDYNNSSNYNSSFRQNSYNNSYNSNNNMYDQHSHNRMYNNNMQPSQSGAMLGGYDNTYNNYRNYNSSYNNNDHRMPNQKNSSNFNRDGGPNKPYPYQKQQHTSRYENYNDNEGRYSSEQYNNNPMYNNNHHHQNNYYNNYPPNHSEYELRENKYNKSQQDCIDSSHFQRQEKSYCDNYPINSNNNINSASITNNNNNNSRSKSRSKSRSNLSRSRSRSSSHNKSRSSSNSSTNSQGKTKNKSHKRLKKSENTINRSHNYTDKSNSQRPDGKNYSDSPNNNHYNPIQKNNQDNVCNSRSVDTTKTNDSFKRQTSIDESNKSLDNDLKNNQNIENSNENSEGSQNNFQNLSKLNENLKDSDKKMDESMTSPNKKESKSEPNVESVKTESTQQKSNSYLPSDQNNKSSASVNSLVEPVLNSSIEDINKFFKLEMIQGLNGVDLNENVNAINSQIILKQMNITSMGAEIKKYRALVRLKEIKKTVQEQRLIFLQTQMKEIEELLN